MHWFDRLAPLLSEDHRVVRVELLGHGGSEKPKAGYGIDEQARGVAEALSELGVENATVVGHSLGATVATALALQSPKLASRIVDIDQAPSNDYGELDFTAKLGYMPIIGQALNRLAHIGPAQAVKDEYQQAFAPDFNISTGFENPDQVVDDLRAMTYTAYTDAAEAEDDYTEETPLDERLAEAGIPVLVMFGDEEQIYDDWEEALAAYRAGVPGVRTAVIAGSGHSPNVEKPDQVARLVLEFASAETEAAAPEPEAAGPSPRKPRRRRRSARARRSKPAPSSPRARRARARRKAAAGFGGGSVGVFGALYSEGPALLFAVTPRSIGSACAGPFGGGAATPSVLPSWTEVGPTLFWERPSRASILRRLTM